MCKYIMLRCIAAAFTSLAAIVTASVSVAQQSSASTPGRPLGNRYLSVSSETPEGLDRFARTVTPTAKDSIRFVEGLKRKNTAVLKVGANDDVDEVASNWRATLGADLKVTVLPDHYARLFAPRSQTVDHARADAVRRVREAFPQERLSAITVSNSDTVANYMLRENSPEVGDMLPGPALGEPRPSIVIPVNGTEYRVRAETFNAETRAVTGAVRDPTDRVVGYASISLASEHPDLKLSVGSNDYFSVPLDAAGDTAPGIADGISDGAAVLVERPAANLVDHDGEAPQASVDSSVTMPVVADPLGDVSPATPTQTVRVVVGYTVAARENLKRMPRSVAQIVVGALAFSNALFFNQDIPVRFDVDESRIVEVPYVERTVADSGGNRPISLDLVALKERTGTLAILESLRVSTAADVVLLVEVVAPMSPGAYPCGEAAAIEASTHADAHAIVNAGCLDSMVSYSLAHELGHLLGARHNRTSLSATAAAEVHRAFGYVNSVQANGGDWRDIMSLPSGCPSGKICPRIPHFSDAQCQGVSPLGTCYIAGTSHENAVALMKRRATVLATVFERSVAPALP